MAKYSVKLNAKTHLDQLINETDKASVLINRFGCETIGYRILDRKGKRELPLLYRDGEAGLPAAGWKNHATVLFPIVGGLVKDQSQIGDQVISSPGLHGIARKSMFKLIKKDTKRQAALTYRLKSSAATRKFYPFEFQLDITYALRGTDLTATFVVTSKEQDRDIYYCLGWHPGFRTPVIDGQGTKLGCQVRFKKGTYRKFLVNKDCKLLGKIEHVKLNGPIKTTEEELVDTILFEIDERANRVVTVRDPKLGLNIEVDFKDFPHLGLWADLGYNFVCIEPWQGMDDHQTQEPFARKVGTVRLPPGGVDQRSVTVRPRFG